jgi:hypothetical protein
MFKVAMILADPERAVHQQRVGASIGIHSQSSFMSIQLSVAFIRAHAAVLIDTGKWWSKAYSPVVRFSPKGRNFPSLPVIFGEDNIHVEIIERVAVGF